MTRSSIGYDALRDIGCWPENASYFSKNTFSSAEYAFSTRNMKPPSAWQIPVFTLDDIGIRLHRMTFVCHSVTLMRANRIYNNLIINVMQWRMALWRFFQNKSMRAENLHEAYLTGISFANFTDYLQTIYRLIINSLRIVEHFVNCLYLAYGGIIYTFVYKKDNYHITNSITKV